MTFREKLEAKWSEGKFVCVDLDTNFNEAQQRLTQGAKHNLVYGIDAALIYFNRDIIDTTKDVVCAYKLNLACYLENMSDGVKALSATIQYIKQVASAVPVILEADTGNTSTRYTRAMFDRFGADAITVHPYFGQEALGPFLDYKGKGIIVLCRTSNPGAGEFQDLMVREPRHPGLDSEFWPAAQPLYQHVARKVAEQWNTNGNCALVVGATYPEELARVRHIVGDMPILIPGIGAQGGDLEATVKAGKDSRGKGMIINSSRGIIYASNGPDFAEAARRETQKLHDQINLYRA